MVFVSAQTKYYLGNCPWLLLTSILIVGYLRVGNCRGV